MPTAVVFLGCVNENRVSFYGRAPRRWTQVDIGWDRYNHSWPSGVVYCIRTAECAGRTQKRRREEGGRREYGEEEEGWRRRGRWGGVPPVKDPGWQTRCRAHNEKEKRESNQHPFEKLPKFIFNSLQIWSSATINCIHLAKDRYINIWPGAGTVYLEDLPFHYNHSSGWGYWHEYSIKETSLHPCS